MGYLARAHTLMSRPAGHHNLLKLLKKNSQPGNLLLRGKKEIFVGTLRLRTLREYHKRDELYGCMRVVVCRYWASRVPGSGQLLPHNILAWRTSNWATIDGVGIPVDRRRFFIPYFLTSVYSQDKLATVANFAGNPAVTIIATYL